MKGLSSPHDPATLMIVMDIEQIRDAARRRGFQLVPLPLASLETLEDVKAGRNTALAVARHRDLAPNAAAMRMRSAANAGLIRESHRELSAGGRPLIVWEVVA